MNKSIQLVECPRDAMQGWQHIIPTELKAAYINALLKVGFHTIDFGSFVSPKAIPQMADTKEVIKLLSPGNSKTKLLAIVANARGAGDAAVYDEIAYLGFPFSISPTFQLKNTNSSIERSLHTVEEIQDLCSRHGKEPVIYISMGFGNPYGDPYSEQLVAGWTRKLSSMGIRIISIADTVGISTADQVSSLLNVLIPSFPQLTIGVHLHSKPVNFNDKLKSAMDAGCMRYDGALKGIGGCPMAGDDLVGNMDTLQMITYFEENNIDTSIDKEALQNALHIAEKVFK